MKHKELFKLLDEVQEQGEDPILKKHDRVLLMMIQMNLKNTKLIMLKNGLKY